MRNVWVLALVCAACTQDKPKAEPRSERPAAAGASSASAPAPAKPVRQPMSITTANAKAAALVVEGRDLVEALRTKEGMAKFAEAEQLDPEFPLAIALHAYGLPSTQALEKLQRAATLAKAKNLPEPERLYIEWLLSQKKGDEAKSRALLMTLVERLPGDDRIQYAAGEQLFFEKKYELAAERYARAVELRPEGIADNMLGYTHAMLGRYDLAIAALERYVKHHPTDPNPPDSLGEIAMMGGEFEKAEAAFEKALGLDPSFFAAWHGLAQLHFLQGEFPAGYAALAKARETADSETQRLTFDAAKAWAQLAEGKPEQALATIEQLEQTAKKVKSPFFEALAPVHKAAILSEVGQLEAADRAVTEALERSSRLTGASGVSVRRRALLRKVLVSARRGNVDEAQQSLDLLVGEAKKSEVSGELRTALYVARGAVAEAKGDFGSAAEEYSRCDLKASGYNYFADQRTEDALCTERLAAMQEATGQKEAAAKTRSEIVSANRRDPVYLYVRAKVGRSPM